MSVTYLDVPLDARTWENYCRAQAECDRVEELCRRLNDALTLHGVHNSRSHADVTMSGHPPFPDVVEIHSRVALNLTIGDAALLFEVLRDARKKEPYR